MAEPLNGMERMMNSLMRAAGFNPEEIQKQMGTVVTQVVTALDTTAKKMQQIHEEQQAQREMLERIIQDLNDLKAVAGIVDTSAAPLQLIRKGN